MSLPAISAFVILALGSGLTDAAADPLTAPATGAGPDKAPMASTDRTAGSGISDTIPAHGSQPAHDIAGAITQLDLSLSLDARGAGPSRIDLQDWRGPASASGAKGRQNQAQDKSMPQSVLFRSPNDVSGMDFFDPEGKADAVFGGATDPAR
ncbi:hypothetical protein ACFMPD_17315 [Sedimentitalea sp. HM32M-2]|uniref:hypothetical protein n=1 Tax=Sedimentitalea sp. HM32M-2 TaxID=3351566 RepID=UPI0036350467